MNRRQALGAMGVGALAFLCRDVVNVFAASDAPKLYIEGWKIAADQAHANGKGLFGFLAQALVFEHLYLKLNTGKGWVYFAGFPTDPETGKITSFLDAQSLLGVHVLSAAENEALRAKHAQPLPQADKTVFPAKPVTGGQIDGMPIERATPSLLTGVLLDMAVAINEKNLRYIPAQINASPPNSNAVAAALLSQLNFCAKDNCGALQQAFPEALAPGINHGLARKVAPGHLYTDMAHKGATPDAMIQAFRDSPAARPHRGAPGRNDTAATSAKGYGL